MKEGSGNARDPAGQVQDGLGLMNWLREQKIRIPVVAISGHARTAEPFPAGALAAAVDSALDAAAYA